MAEKKRKTREETTSSKLSNSRGKLSKSPNPNKKKKSGKKEERRNKGPRLPNALRKQLEPNANPSLSDEEINSDEEGLEMHVKDVYEYDEPEPEEETKKNRRYDPVENLEYDLPDEFEDENLSSDDEGHGEKHGRMLQGITGMPAEAFEDSRKKNVEVVSEIYPESEFNPTQSVINGDGGITMDDLIYSIPQEYGYSEVRRKMEKFQKKSKALHTPLAKSVKDNMERKVAYQHTKEDMTKWEPLIKKNREAATLFFDENVDMGNSTIGTIATDFEPRTEFEKKMASLVHDPTIVDAHKEDGARLLELNKVSIEDVKERHNYLAKLRNILFIHEKKAKQVKKIKSKTYHRLMKKDKMKATLVQLEMDPDAAKEQAMKQEFKRTEERMTLKHKNNSKWAKRILQRGLDNQDEGTRSAISQQLHQHTLLTRKMNSMKDSSSDESSDEDDHSDDEVTEQNDASKLLTKAKEKTIKTMAEDEAIPISGVISLPFMVRGLKKRKEEADREAKLALEEYELSLKQLDDSNTTGNPNPGTLSGRRVFGAVKKHSEGSSKRDVMDNYDRGSDSEEEFKQVDVNIPENFTSQKAFNGDGGIYPQVTEFGGEPVFKSFDDIVRDPGPKTTHEVSIFALDSRRKVGSKNAKVGSDKKRPEVVEVPLPHQEHKEVDEDGETDNEEMVDGIISSGTDTMTEYELPSQADLIHRAFAGDDVEEEFEKDKMDVLNEENPEPEKPVLLPGWGQWTNIQKKIGMPSWMREDHESAKKKREDALKKRKDAHLKHVIISEKINKKSEKLLSKSLPFPYTSKEVFEQSRRMPIGPGSNPATSVGALNRPDVVKKPGLIIKPIAYENVDPYEKSNDHRKGENQKSKRSNNGKSIKKTKAKGKN